MFRNPKQLFLQEYIGLANRLDSLMLAFAIQGRFGHEIWLDWQELDALAVAGTQTGSPGFLGRWGALRLRSCPSEVFVGLSAHRRILLRTYEGPAAELDPLLQSTLKRISLRAWVVEEIQAVFRAAEARPVVGVHIRRGDYPLGDKDTYDVLCRKHPAVPLWWYQEAMQQILHWQPEAIFYVSCSGLGNEADDLRQRFPTLRAKTRDGYHRRRAGHEAVSHPVVDLFALACCPVLLATPLSSFSHYAANLLGPSAACLLPPVRTTRGTGVLCQIKASNLRLPEWTRLCRSGASHLPVAADGAGMTFGTASTDWLRAG